MRVISIGLAIGFAFLIAPNATAENQQEEPSPLICLKTLQQLDDFSINVMQSGCLGVVEEYCSSLVKNDEKTACLNRAILELRNYRHTMTTQLPPTLESGSAVQQQFYAETVVKVLKSDVMTVCNLSASLCELVTEFKAVVDALSLARLAKVTLP